MSFVSFFRYSEGQPGNRYYGGNEVIDKVLLAARVGRSVFVLEALCRNDRNHGK